MWVVDENKQDYPLKSSTFFLLIMCDSTQCKIANKLPQKAALLSNSEFSFKRVRLVNLNLSNYCMPSATSMWILWLTALPAQRSELRRRAGGNIEMRLKWREKWVLPKMEDRLLSIICNITYNVWNTQIPKAATSTRDLLLSILAQ